MGLQKFCQRQQHMFHMPQMHSTLLQCRHSLLLQACSMWLPSGAIVLLTKAVTISGLAEI